MGDMSELDEQNMYNDYEDDYWRREFHLPRRLTVKDKLCRWSWNQRKALTPVKINKFYVGAEHIAQCIANGVNDDWTHSTLDDAINHGKAIMERDDKECVLIVKIVAVLKREARPIRVEKL